VCFRWTQQVPSEVGGDEEARRIMSSKDAAGGDEGGTSRFLRGEGQGRTYHCSYRFKSVYTRGSGELAS
jgi:hypothetical protein